MCSLVSPAERCACNSPWRRASTAHSLWISSCAASSPITNFAAAPPARRKSLKYSRSITGSQSFGCNGSVRISSIAWVRDEPHGVVVVLRAGLVEQGQAFCSLGAGGAAQFETVAAAGAGIGGAVEPQQVDQELLDWIIDCGGRQQRQYVVQRGEGDQRSLTGAPVRCQHDIGA